MMDSLEKSHSKFQVLNVPMVASSLSQISSCLVDLAAAGHSGYVCALSVHTVTLAQFLNPLFNALGNSILNVPDGRPLAWLGQLQGNSRVEQIRGPDLMLEICDLSRNKNIRHFLLGGKPGVADQLKGILEQRFSGIQIVGTFSPPFRELNEADENEILEILNRAQPHIIWVGLGTPKQEQFCFAYSNKWKSGIMFSVGAAFDIHSGLLADSPKWIQQAGLQWVHRLIQEPTRLWKRYLMLNPIFLYFVFRDWVQKTFNVEGTQTNG
jgi:N-acetylglucosaminyldiphosphoundecaprenol N-acetyl-beta-D-mannosaminyltransferase